MGAGEIAESGDRRRGLRSAPERRTPGVRAGSAFLGLAMAGLVLLVVLVLVPGLAVLGVVAMVGLPPTHGLVLALVLWAGDLFIVRYGVPLALLGIRRLAKFTRRMSEEWLALPISSPTCRRPITTSRG